MSRITPEYLRQVLDPTGANDPLSLDKVLNTSVGKQKISDLPQLKEILSALAVDGAIPLETVLDCVKTCDEQPDANLLPKSSGSAQDALGTPVSGLSFMASIMMLMLRQASEQRRTGQEMRAAQTDLVQKRLLDAADDMRTGAIVALSMGIASGIATIGGGLVSLGTVGAGLRADGNLNAALTKAQSYSAIAGGTAGILKSLGDGVQSLLGASSKEKEAEAERTRSFRDQLVEFNNTLRDQTQSVMQLMQALVDKENEAMTRIMV